MHLKGGTCEPEGRGMGCGCAGWGLMDGELGECGGVMGRSSERGKD